MVWRRLCSVFSMRLFTNEVASSPLAQRLRFADHLAVIVWVEAVAPPVPWHNEDDVPNVGPCTQLHQDVERREMCVDPILQHGIGCTSPLLLNPTAVNETIRSEDISCPAYETTTIAGREVPLRLRLSRDCSTPLMMSGSPRHLTQCQTYSYNEAPGKRSSGRSLMYSPTFRL